MKFKDYKLKTYLLNSLNKKSFLEPTDVQEVVIPKLLHKENVIVKSATGTGKTHAFLIPMLQSLDENDKNLQKIIISPTRELAMQLYKELTNLLDASIEVDCRLYVGGTDREQEIKRLEKSQPQIIVGTIGKINDLAISSNILKIHQANMIIIDEADMVFEDSDIENVDKVFSKIPNNIQIGIFSATISKNLLTFLKKYLNNYELIDLSVSSFTKSSINHIFIPTKNKDKNQLLVNVLHSFTPYLVLIFANTKNQVDFLADYLANNNIKVGKLTGDLQSRERKQMLKRIKDGEYKYLVASDIASRGLDIEGVSHVINYELPEDIDFFIHRVGRTARYNFDGTAISFYDFEDDLYIEKLQNKGLKCTYMAMKDGNLVATKERNQRPKSSKVIKIEEELHLKTPMPKKVKPGYRKKRNIEIKKKLRKMKRSNIDSMYHKKEHSKNND